MVTEKRYGIKAMKAKTETEHNGDWKKNAYLKTNESKTETEHNGNWKMQV